jgi:thiosulfate dehydrogenase [quinone] large subunit
MKRIHAGGADEATGLTRFDRTPTAVLRTLFGIVWLVDAFFKWQPGFRSGFTPILEGMVSSQPGIIRPWFQFWALLATHTGPLLPDATAITETALGIALIIGIARRPVYVVGAMYALFVWAVGEGFGGPYALGSSTDVGAALIYAFVFACLFILDRRPSVRTLSLQHISVPAQSENMDVRQALAAREETAAIEALRRPVVNGSTQTRR